jgi:uncharacterized protein YutE (UPF0331/DUF86 family)
VIDGDLIARKLIILKGYLEELEPFKDITFEEYKKDYVKKRAVERLLQLLVEVASDVSSYVLVESGKAAPKDYYDSFIRAPEVGLLSQALADKLAPSAGLRNRLVHEYGDVRDDIVLKSIPTALQHYTTFISEVNTFLKAL